MRFTLSLTVLFESTYATTMTLANNMASPSFRTSDIIYRKKLALRRAKLKFERSKLSSVTLTRKSKKEVIK